MPYPLFKSEFIVVFQWISKLGKKVTFFTDDIQNFLLWFGTHAQTKKETKKQPAKNKVQIRNKTKIILIYRDIIRDWSDI